REMTASGSRRHTRRSQDPPRTDALGFAEMVEILRHDRALTVCQGCRLRELHSLHPRIHAAHVPGDFRRDPAPGVLWARWRLASQSAMSSTCSTEFRPWTPPLWSPYPLCWQSLRSLLLSFPLCAPLQLIRSLLFALREELAPCRLGDRILQVLERAALI